VASPGFDLGETATRGFVAIRSMDALPIPLTWLSGGQLLDSVATLRRPAWEDWGLSLV
jgi:hypothetical protein